MFNHKIISINMFNHKIISINMFNHKISRINMFNHKIISINMFNHKIISINMFNHKIISIDMFNHKIISINMFNHKYKTFNAHNFKQQCTQNDLCSKTERRKKQDGARWWRNATKRAKQATKFGNVVIIWNRRKSEAMKLEAAKVEVLLYMKLC
jgi:hypothetical protein